MFYGTHRLIARLPRHIVENSLSYSVGRFPLRPVTRGSEFLSFSSFQFRFGYLDVSSDWRDKLYSGFSRYASHLYVFHDVMSLIIASRLSLGHFLKMSPPLFYFHFFKSSVHPTISSLTAGFSSRLSLINLFFFFESREIRRERVDCPRSATNARGAYSLFS